MIVTNNLLLSIFLSSKVTGNIDQLYQWIDELNKKIKVVIQKIPLVQSDTWAYCQQTGEIAQENRSFFSIKGIQKWKGNNLILEQPIIIQDEIGYLGIICKEFKGVLHFLMQAKIEPGNVNKIQISPTIQATKSNFTQKHGGKKPAYLDYFLNASAYEIIIDQIQSEQSSRFLKKRNRNIIIKIDEEIEILPNFKWMTLGHLKQLMKRDNIVNMDTRTVLSCIPFFSFFSTVHKKDYADFFAESEFYRSIFEGDYVNHLPGIYHYINNVKMFDDSAIITVPLFKLQSWEMKNGEFTCKYPYPFKLIFCDIMIEGREVKRWTQPLLEAQGVATFGLLMCDIGGVRKFLVKAVPEIGCFDKLEIGPTIQCEATETEQEQDAISRLFWSKLDKREGIYHDVKLSEEGGRFYHEQNRNVVIKVLASDLPSMPEGYFLLDYKTLNQLVQVNNTLNIQLRNLLSLLEV